MMCKHCGQSTASVVQFNSPGDLPPVECPLLLLVDGAHVKAERTAYVSSKGREMEYRLEDGSVIVGKYPWTYP